MPVGGASDGIGGGNQPPYEPEKEIRSTNGASKIDTGAAAAASGDAAAGKTGRATVRAAAASLPKDDEGVAATARHLKATHISDKAAKAAAKAASVAHVRHITDVPYDVLHHVFEQSNAPLSKKDLFRFLIALPLEERKKYLLANPSVVLTILETTKGDLRTLPPRIRALITSLEIAQTVTTLPSNFHVDGDRYRENNIEQIVTIFTSLTTLDCDSITDSQLALIVTRLKKLEILQITLSRITEKGLAQLAACKATLKELQLDKFAKITSIAQIRELENLVTLNLSNSHIAHLQGLENFTKLESLDLSRCDGIKDQELAALIGHRSLQSLTLGGILLTDESAACIGQIPNLRRLHASTSAKLTPKFFASLPLMRALENLSLPVQVPITDQTVQNFQNLPNLRSLRVYCSLSDKGMSGFSALTKLQSLNVTFTNPELTQVGIASLATSLPQLARLEIVGHIGGGEAVAHLATMNNLEYLCLERTDITSVGVARLGSCRRLRTLQLITNPDIKDAFIDGLIRNPKAFERLERLVIPSIWISPDKIAELRRARPQLAA